MIDLHSHILPKMDDGSKSVEESEALLKMLKDQGVSTVVMTPHFYAFQEDPAHFIKRRTAAAERLQPVMDQSGLKIHLGAEVHFYSGISETDLTPLLIEGTDLVLVEMPFGRWDERTVNEIIDLSAKYTVVLAHIERYFQWQPVSKPVWDVLERAGVLFQVNCSAVLQGWKSHKIIKLFEKEKIAFLSSDAHNLQHRPPRFDEACTVLKKKLSNSQLDRLFRNSENIFSAHASSNG
ncbi:MAG: hypothetical protein HUJ55_06785 [Ileibacterium sp.]|nr:hypothetical protein [Ileibacterium sp.]